MGIYRINDSMYQYSTFYIGFGSVLYLLLLTSLNSSFVGPVIIHFHVCFNHLFEIKSTHFITFDHFTIMDK